MAEITKVLIANRGEIAVRIARTCREMGLQTVAVYSQADATALHTQAADEAYYLGPAPAAQSYLNAAAIIKIACTCGAQAIHPGYGFLSENAAFAEAVSEAGLVFVGPPASAIRIMGDKTAARAAMQRAGVPIVPGSPEPLASADEATALAEGMGYPVLLKAAAGGGGKGMRVVQSAPEMQAAFRAASSEAQSAFGDGRVYLEKYLEEPRHIEFQILADHHGRVIHLGERECSIQRRHQKVIEEAPSAIMTPELRQQMGAAAVRAAAACGYTNAGTIEFLVDKQRHFYFLEMNTRLQVEHPVTELITGLDLVQLQLEIAAGKPLPLTQEQVRFDGHAIECRIYAEDIDNNFLPDTGSILAMERPGGPGVRDDAGVGPGDEISIYYDPMIAKLIVRGANRRQAIHRMVRALREYKILGVKTTIPFCAWVLHHPHFQSGQFNTFFVQQEFIQKGARATDSLSIEEKHAVALASVLFAAAQSNGTRAVAGAAAPAPANAWRLRGWKLRHRKR